MYFETVLQIAKAKIVFVIILNGYMICILPRSFANCKWSFLMIFCILQKNWLTGFLFGVMGVGMSEEIKRPCAQNACNQLVTDSDRYCPVHAHLQVARKKQAACFQQKKNGNSAERGYDRRWRKYRLHFLRVNPLCVICQAAGRVTPATVVDHIIPHRGVSSLFWDYDNHQALCVACHVKKTAMDTKSMTLNS